MRACLFNWWGACADMANSSEANEYRTSPHRSRPEHQYLTAAPYSRVAADDWE